MLINFDGNIIDAKDPIIRAENGGFRYGDGLFETMRFAGGRVMLATYHFDRLFSGLQLLHFERPGYLTSAELTRQIEQLCALNNHEDAARVRLMVFRGDPGLGDPLDSFPHYIIQTSSLPIKKDKMVPSGIRIDIYPKGRKAIDGFSHLKSNNYLLYAMAAFYARQQQLDDCLILNSQDRICESSIANLFCVHDKVFYTVPLSEGCVAGVMRRRLIELLQNAGLPIIEKECSSSFLQMADEVFLTNAIQGIRSVLRFGNKEYDQTSRFLLDELLAKDFG
jgi:branched-chain amino acid aminotransferase